MKKEKDNLFEAFDMFWTAADKVRKSIKDGEDLDIVFNFAYDLSEAMDYYEMVQDEYYPENLIDSRTCK